MEESASKSDVLGIRAALAKLGRKKEQKEGAKEQGWILDGKEIYWTCYYLLIRLWKEQLAFSTL